jgi:hypothetical protein
MDPALEGVAEILLLVAKAYGPELAGALEELAKRMPGAVAQFLRDHPVSDAQWDPTMNPHP